MSSKKLNRNNLGLIDLSQYIHDVRDNTFYIGTDMYYFKVCTNVDSLYNELILYSNNNKHVVDYINSDWKNNIIEDITNIIFDESATKEQRIYNIHNKITIRTTDFINEVTSKYLKNGE